MRVPAPSRQWHSQPSPPVYRAATRQSLSRDNAGIQRKINLLQILKKEVAIVVISTGFPCSDSREGHWKRKYSTWHFAKVFCTASPARIAAEVGLIKTQLLFEGPCPFQPGRAEEGQLLARLTTLTASRAQAGGGAGSLLQKNSSL